VERPVLNRRPLALLEIANGSLGCDIVDVTEQLHAGYRTLATRLAADMGLRFAGIDLITPLPIEAPPTEYCILEVTPGPFLGSYAGTGPRARRATADA
jgi:D-alanine-D-alanine ligase-like ATP-grasp enzyme